MNPTPRSGELSTLLLIISALTILAGTIIGSQSVITKSSINKLLRADGVPTTAPFSCNYNATAEVRVGSSTGRLLTKSEMDNGIWGTFNDKQGSLIARGQFGEESRNNYTTSNLILDGVGQNYTKGGKASVTLVGPGGNSQWKIQDAYCKSDPTATVNGCPTDMASQFTSGLFKTIKGFTVDCGVNLTYGWVVRQEGTGGTNPSGKQSYQLDVSDGSGAANDMCFMVADSNGAIYSPTGSDHCNSAVCKNGSSPSKVIVDYKNVGSSSKAISWQQNACNGKVIGELSGTGKNECNDYLDSKSAPSLAAGRTIRCIWDAPLPKQTPDINSDPNCTTLTETDTSTPQSLCSSGGTTGTITPPTQPTSATSPTSSPYPARAGINTTRSRSFTTTYIFDNQLPITSTSKISFTNIHLKDCIGTRCSEDSYPNEYKNHEKGTLPNSKLTTNEPMVEPVPWFEYVGKIFFTVGGIDLSCEEVPPSPLIGPDRSIKIDIVLEPDGDVRCNSKKISQVGVAGQPTLAAPTSIVVPTSINNPPSTQACERVAGTGDWGIAFVQTNDGLSDEEFNRAITRDTNANLQTNLGDIISRFSYYKYTNLVENMCPFAKNVFNCDLSGDTTRNDLLKSVNLFKTIKRECVGIKTIVIEKKGSVDLSLSSFVGGFSLRGGNITFMLSNRPDVNDTIDKVDAALAHELGHSIAGLDDEAIARSSDNRSDEKESINCSFTKQTCSKWSSITADCVEGCFVSNWFKSSEKSIMNYRENMTYDFNQVSLINGWRKVFPNSPHALASKPAPKLQKIIDLTLNSSSSISLKSLNVKQGYVPDKSPFDSLNSNSVAVNLVSNTGAVLYTKYEDLTYQVTDGPAQTFRPKELYITLPYSDNAVKITVTDDKNRELLSIPLNTQIKALSNNTKLKAVCGNTICDAGFGETVNSCAADCGPKKKTDLDRKLELASADLDGNNIINNKDLMILMKMYGKKQKVEGIREDINHDGVVNGLDLTIIMANL